MTNSIVLKRPYRVYDDFDKELGKFRTEKQARTFAKNISKMLAPLNDGRYNSVLVTHLYKEYDSIYEDQIISYEYKGKQK